MTTPVVSGDRLYRLMPALYRQRDAAAGEPLRALLGVLEHELEVLETDIDRLYENWFIETCDEWVVAYLGDLLGVSQLGDEQHLVFSQRARVANTLRYRRRKGTVAALQAVAQDATGWHARAVASFERVAAMQHTQHVRLDRAHTIDLRGEAALESPVDPFDRTARLVDVRRIGSGRGRHNVHNVGVFIWRASSYPLSHAGRPVPGEPRGRFTFDVLGRDLPLFGRPHSPDADIDAGVEDGLPRILSRRAFAADLADYHARHRTTPEVQRPADTGLYGPRRSFVINVEGVPIAPSRVVAADLADWVLPTAGVAIDVERGRIAFAAGERPKGGVVVSYRYGFSADLGGGPYDRQSSLAVPAPDTFHAQVATAGQTVANESVPAFATMAEAVEAWRASGRPGLIEILDSEAYELPALELPAGHALTIQAVDGVRPAFRSASVAVRVAGSTASDVADTALIFNGVLFAGDVEIAGSLALTLHHCSVPGGVTTVRDADAFHLTLDRAIVGPLRCAGEGTSIDALDTIVDGAVTATGFRCERTTLLGAVAVREMALASETIFAAPVTVERRQTGAIRFSYVPSGSVTPPRFRCQPDLALAGANAPTRPRVERRLAPVFTSVRFGDPGFAQLSARCAAEIAAGAEDGSEMGAFHHLHQPQRAATLRAIVEEYLPLGLEAGIVFVS